MSKPLTPEQVEARKQYQKEWREANKDLGSLCSKINRDIKKNDTNY